MQIIKEKLVKFSMILIICVLCLSVVGVILFGVKQFQIGSQLASVNQVANLSHLLVRQQTNFLSTLLVNNAKTEKFNENLDNLTKESFILDASLYANNGQLLAQSSNHLNWQQQLDPVKNNEMVTQQIVEPIYSANGLEGFLRVTFDAKYGQTTQSKINQIFYQLYGELFIIFLAGVILASSVHYFLSHFRRVRRLELSAINVPSKKSKNTASKNFHRRRRRI
ncbi:MULTISPECIES: YtjB family periplasmic protein [unclassified Lonepinella]|uniref:YtjB family periplasmic protein n=1 Tax=unclassified Lonepinella TaxID=2642006 RepID=UPI0036DA432C